MHGCLRFGEELLVAFVTFVEFGGGEVAYRGVCEDALYALGFRRTA